MMDSEKKTEVDAPAEELPGAEPRIDPAETAASEQREEAAASSDEVERAAEEPAEAPADTALDDAEAAIEAAADRAAVEANVEELMAGLANDAAAEEAAVALAALEAERDALKDRLMRALAEAENVRRRAERDRKDAETYGGTRLARDLLTVYDNIERALANADDALRDNHGAFLEGVELTGRELLNAFAKHKIEKTAPEKGDRFDPNLHQAMFEAPVPGAEPGTIIEVMQPGFTIAGRLLRPALVGVARAA